MSNGLYSFSCTLRSWGHFNTKAAAISSCISENRAAIFLVRWDLTTSMIVSLVSFPWLKRMSVWKVYVTHIKSKTNYEHKHDKSPRQMHHLQKVGRQRHVACLRSVRDQWRRSSTASASGFWKWNRDTEYWIIYTVNPKHAIDIINVLCHSLPAPFLWHVYNTERHQYTKSIYQRDRLSE